MNPSTVPVGCSLALTAVLSAGISHWWSVRQFSGLLENGVPVAPTVIPDQSAPLSSPLLASKPSVQQQAALAGMVDSGNNGQKDFYEALIDKMTRMETQNRDLLDQLAETNRDLMKLEFRVDTHSESFRPLPIADDKPFSNIDQNPGVLPPRAEPVQLPSYE